MLTENKKETTRRGRSGEAEGAGAQFVRQESALLSLDVLVTRFQRVAVELLGSSPETFLAVVASDVSPEGRLAVIDRITGFTDSESAPGVEEQVHLDSAMAKDAKRIADEHGQALRRRVVQLADQAGVRVQGAYAAAMQLRTTIDALRQDADALMQDKELVFGKLRAACLVPVAGRKRVGIIDVRREDSSNSRDDILLEYLITRLDVIAIAAAQKMLRTTGEWMLQALQETSNIIRRLEGLSRRLPILHDEEYESATEPSVDSRLNMLARRTLDGQRHEMSRQLDQTVRNVWLDRRGGLAALADVEDEFEAQLASEVMRLARASVIEAAKRIDFAGEIVAMASEDDDGLARFRNWLEQMHPPVLSAGGARAFLLAVGAEADTEPLQQLIETETMGQCSVVNHPDSALGFVCCGEQVSLASAARCLIHGRNTAEIARRLHTRIDVQWKPLR